MVGRRAVVATLIDQPDELKALCEMGIFTRDNKWYWLVPDMTANIVER